MSGRKYTDTDDWKPKRSPSPNSSKPEELTDKIDETFGGYWDLNYMKDELKQDLVLLINSEIRQVLDRLEEANYPKSCEPECSKERHAFHEGGWEHMERVDTFIEAERQRYAE